MSLRLTARPLRLPDRQARSLPIFGFRGGEEGTRGRALSAVTSTAFLPRTRRYRQGLDDAGASNVSARLGLRLLKRHSGEVFTSESDEHSSELPKSAIHVHACPSSRSCMLMETGISIARRGLQVR